MVYDAEQGFPPFRVVVGYLVAQLRPCLAAVGALIEGVGCGHPGADILLQGVGAGSGQAIVERHGAFYGSQAHYLDDFHHGGAVCHDVAGEVDDAVERGGVVAEGAVDGGTAHGEVDIESALFLAQDAGVVVGAIAGDVAQHGVVSLQLTGTARVVGHDGERGTQRGHVDKPAQRPGRERYHVTATLLPALHVAAHLSLPQPGIVLAAQLHGVGIPAARGQLFAPGGVCHLIVAGALRVAAVALAPEHHGAEAQGVFPASQPRHEAHGVVTAQRVAFR